MSLLKFKSGGIHPPAEKELAPSAAYSVLPMPKLLTIPMAQHLGAPAVVTVEKKAKLEAGDVIGEPAGFVSTFIHTPVAGTVKTIDRIPLGASVTPVVNLEPTEDAAVWALDEAVEPVDLASLTPTDILERVKTAGVVGMGGATFPTHVKLSPPRDNPVDTVILNGAECEPYLTADDCLMRRHAAAMVEGCRLVMHALGVHRGFVGVEDNKPLALERVREVAQRYPEIDVVELRTQYPQGAEKQLIEACTGRRVPPGKLPFSVGALVQNVGTAAAIYEAVVHGRPLARRLVTVSGRAVNRPGNVLAPVGAPIRDLIEHCGGLRQEVVAVVLGGPMMGRTTVDLGTPVTKGTSGLLLLTAGEIPVLAEQPCLRCGKCVTVCPMDLVPVTLEKLVGRGRFDEATDVMDCVECGCCSYTCPSNRRLVHRFRLAKWELGKRRRLEQAKKKAAG